jgi:protocatechuate 3,4-dioxygenase beta subunit
MIMRRGKRIVILYVCLAAIPSVCTPARSDQAGAKQATLTGKVVDGIGRPIGGVKVRLFQETYANPPYAPQVSVAAEATAQEDGSFSFRVPTPRGVYPCGYVVVQKEGLALGFAAWDMQRDQTADLTLGEAQPLGGIIVDETGLSVPDAAVSIYLVQIDTAFERYRLSTHVAPHLLTTRTNATGRFEFTNLPAGASVELLVRKSGRAMICTFVPSGMYGRPLRYPVGQTDIRLVQRAEAKIEGAVVQKQTGQPVGGITLVVVRSGNEPLQGYAGVDVGADGTFTMPGLPAGQYALQIAPRKGGAVDWVAAPVPVTLKAGETQKDVKIEVSHGGILEVAVTDAAAHKPLEEASASIRSARSGEWFSGTSDAQGIARLRLAPGVYEMLNAYKQGYMHADVTEGVTIEEGVTKRVAVTLKETPAIHGTVCDPNGAPTEGARVRILPGGQQETTSDAEGKFELTWDPQDWSRSGTVFCLVARHEARNLAAVVEVTEGRKDLVVELEPAAALTGRVADPNGQGIAGACVNAMLRGSGWRGLLSRDEIRTDSKGTFELRAVPAGRTYDVDVFAGGYGSKSYEHVLVDTVGKDRLDLGGLTLPPAGLSVTGRVVDVHDEPVANAFLNMYGDGQPTGVRAQSDTDGRFTLQGVCPGGINIEVTARPGGKELSAIIFTDGGAAGLKIIVREGRPCIQRIGGRSYGQILATAAKIIAGVGVDAQGAPVADVPVAVCCHKTVREGRTTWTFGDYRELGATTDAQGRFALELKEDGEYNLRFSPDHQAATIVYDVPVGRKDLKVTLPEGGTVTGRLVRLEKGRKVAIPNAEIKVEQTSRWSFSHLGFDRDRSTVTDADGRFRVEHLATLIRADEAQPGFVPRTWKVFYGDTEQTIAFDGDATTKDIELLVQPDPASAPPLAGNPLPSFEGIAIELPSGQTQGKSLLVCFFDASQRPSRYCVQLLSRRAAELRTQGVLAIAIQAGEGAGETLDAWAKSADLQLPIATIEGDLRETKATWAVRALPWLILTDGNHVVRAEGFALNELDDRMGQSR